MDQTFGCALCWEPVAHEQRRSWATHSGALLFICRSCNSMLMDRLEQVAITRAES